MGPLDFIFHAFGFAAPAFVVGILVALAARITMPRQAKRSAWWSDAAINFVVGFAVLALGLWYFGVDGKMATYAALVAAIASAQWARSQGWRG
jgi:hypothetical protein